MPEQREPPGLWQFVRMGTTMAVLVAGGLVTGLYVDSRAHTLPAFTMTGLAIGIVATCLYGYAKFRRF
jgi:hypothetical protein